MSYYSHRPSSGARIFRLVLAIAFGVALGLLLYYGYGDRARKALLRRTQSQVTGSPVYTEAPRRIREVLSATEDDITCSRRNAIVRAVNLVEPCVVSLSVTEVRLYTYGTRDPFWELFFPQRRFIEKVPSMGSGFIVSEDGYILTNRHVVRNANEVIVNLPDGRQFKVENVEEDILADRDTDIALVKIDAHGLPFVRLGDSDEATIGEWAIAIGNPFGMIMSGSRPTVTVGVISALNRDFGPGTGETVYQDMIQTDAAINPGNSGGPLVNCLGEVIGINTFIVSKIEGSIGLGFAIPINRAKRVMDEMIRYGRVRGFWTGLAVENISPWMARRLGLKSTEGVVVSQVTSDSPAERAGFKVGDVITAVNGSPVRDEQEIRSMFVDGTVGMVYDFSIIRRATTMKLSFQLEEDRAETTR